jgi:NADH-quinone oxidoreductase subunit J
MEQLFFLIFAAVAIGSAVAVVSLRNPVHCALALMVCLFQVACLFVLLRSPFLAVVQVFIYVGAVMVLFLFVVLVIDVKKIVMETFPLRKKGLAFWIIVAIALEVEIVLFWSRFSGVKLAGPGTEVKVETLAKVLFTKYLFPFEVVSVVLLVAMVGAIVMTKQRRG